MLRRGMRQNRTLADLLAALTAEQRQALHAAFGFLAQARGHIHGHPHERIAKHA